MLPECARSTNPIRDAEPETYTRVRSALTLLNAGFLNSQAIFAVRRPGDWGGFHITLHTALSWRDYFVDTSSMFRLSALQSGIIICSILYPFDFKNCSSSASSG